MDPPADREQLLRHLAASIPPPAGAPAVRVAVDGDLPAGFCRDSFDLDRLRSDLLDPLSPGGSGRYRLGVFDWRTG